MSEQSDPPAPTQISVHVPKDLIILPISAAFLGLTIGFMQGSQMSSLRFLAENAHRRPTTIRGWYFYNKTKNYRVLLGGMKAGGKQALKLGAMGVAYVGFAHGWTWLSKLSINESSPLEQMSDVKDVIAGGGTAAIVSAVYRLPRRMTLRTVGLGVGVGASVSLLRKAQDILGRESADPPPS